MPSCVQSNPKAGSGRSCTFLPNKPNRTFQFLVDSGKSWSECKLKVQRSVEARNVATKGWKAVQGKELRKRFEDEAKFKKLVESRKQSGLFYEDADFPNDDDETRFDIRYINLWVLFG